MFSVMGSFREVGLNYFSNDQAKSYSFGVVLSRVIFFEAISVFVSSSFQGEIAEIKGPSDMFS